MESLSAFQLAYLALILVASFAVRGSAGFGGLNGPLLMIVLPAKVVIPGLVFLGVVSSGAIVVRDYRQIDWRAVWRTLPYGIFGTLIGLWLFKSLDANAIEKGLGAFLLVYGLFALWRIGRAPRHTKIPPGVLAGVMGTLSGVIGTMFGAMAGVFVAVFLDILELAKGAFRATMAAILLAMGVFRAAGFIVVGAVTTEVLILIGVALPLIWIGIVLGNRMHASLNQQAFNRLVGVLFVLIGAFLFLR
jgi:uncharacterized membrane protein YfcA